MSSLDPCREGKSGGGENKCLSFTWILKATPPIAKILASFFFRAMGISFEIRMRPDQSLQNVVSHEYRKRSILRSLLMLSYHFDKIETVTFAQIRV
tara:strand:- start:2385 stop:2672 length:288 start_codon:yes stop_codon:yes gene_type:complete